MVLVGDLHLHGTDGAPQLLGPCGAEDSGTGGGTQELQCSADGDAGPSTAGCNGGACHGVRQGVEAAAVDGTVGIQAVFSCLQLPLGLSADGGDGGDGDAVEGIEQVGTVDSLQQV